MERASSATLPVEPPQVLRKSSFRIRFLVLFLACVNMMVAYYCLDNPAALHHPLKNHFAEEFGEKRFEKYFNFLYTAYSLPNIILPLIGGVMIDRLGYRVMNILFIVFLVIGHSMFAMGIADRDMDLAIGGRVVFGLGGECLLVGLSALLVDWFGGAGEFAMVMGVKMSLGRLGSVLNNVGSRALYHDHGIAMAVWFGSILLCVSLVMAIIFLLIDLYIQTEIKTHADGLRLVLENRVDEASLEALSTPELDEAPMEDKPYFHIRDITSLKLTYWLLVVSCVLLYGCIIPFNHVASALIIEKFLCHGNCCAPGVLKCPALTSAENKASFVMGIPFITTCVLSPLVGFLVDKFGGNAVLIMSSALTLIVVHFVLSLTDTFWLLIVTLVFLGLAYTIYASSLWPSVPSTVKPDQVGTAYGLMTSLQNVGLSIFPLCVAEIRGESGSYSYVEIFFTCLAALGSVFAVYTYIHDRSEGGVLNMSAVEKEQHSKNQYQRIASTYDDSDEFGSTVRQRRPMVEADEDNTTLISR